MSRAVAQGSVNLYVKNLDESIGDEELRELFSPFGKILSAKVMTEAGRSRGFGFVSFESEQVAETVLREMNGKFVRRNALYVAVAQRKEDRAKMLALQYAKRQGTT